MKQIALKVWNVFKHLSLGLVLIAATSAVLLFSDWNQRRVGQAALPRVAVLKYASRPMMDELVEGAIAALAENHFQPAKDIALTIYNAENDMSTATSIAKELVAGKGSLLITFGTPSLQAVAQANREGRNTHIFGGVTDPFGAGVGIHREAPLDHPPHLAGIGSFQPVESLFRLMKKELFPGLKTVGVVWNPSEACSQACTFKARRICRELDIELIETSVEKSSDVNDAANSLIARGAQAIWLGGDNTVDMAVDALVAAARKARIPVVSHAPNQLANGVCVVLGANYREVGYLTGQMAAKALRGADVRQIPVENILPERLGVNLIGLKSLKDNWNASPTVRERADLLLDETGLHEKVKAKAAPAPSSARMWKLHIIRYADASHSEDTCRGLLAGLAEAGLREGVDIKTHVQSAQGQISMLNSLVDLASNDHADMILAVGTPTLQAVMNRMQTTPIIYATVASGVQAGAGRTPTDHKPNVTGVDTLSAYADMAEILRQCLPSVRKVGTLFTPGESNSVFGKERLREDLQKKGIELVTVPVEAPGEVSDAILSLSGRQIDAVCQLSDNLCTSCFTSIISAADRAKLPVFSFVSVQARQGSVLAVARDYEEVGHEAARLAARVIRGESPARIPFLLPRSYRLVINLKQADKHGVHVPEALLKRADELIK